MPKKTTKKTISDRDLGRKLREVYMQAKWDASGLCQSAEDAQNMAWDAVARAARKAVR